MSDVPWVRWSGGKQPVDDETWVEVMLGTRRTNKGPARAFSRLYQKHEIGWRKVGDKYDIIAWRLTLAPPPHRHVTEAEGDQE
jgi:hypothetical protein